MCDMHYLSFKSLKVSCHPGSEKDLHSPFQDKSSSGFVFSDSQEGGGGGIRNVHLESFREDI